MVILNNNHKRYLMINKRENVVARKIHDTFFLIDITDNYSDDKCVLYEINESGMFIWNSIDRKKTIDEIAALLKVAIIDDIDYQIIYDDVVDFVNALKAKQFVKEEA